MNSLDFTVRFHSPFRVGGAYAGDGAQQSIDMRDVLPADSLKGLMRAAAVDLLGERHDLVAQVFGTHSAPSPWAWHAAHPTGSWVTSVRHRVTIDDQTRSAATDKLVLGEQVWAEQAGFSVEQIRFVAPTAVERHHRLLRVSAGQVHGLGAWRRRGLGWVQITPDAGPVTRADVEHLLAERLIAATAVNDEEL